MKIAFVCPYPLDKAPSQRFRFEQYFQTLSEAGVQYDFYSFLSNHFWNNLYASKGILFNIRMLFAGFLKRFLLLLKISRYDYVFIHRETTPIGPPVFEWLIAKVFQKKIIYDFDDAIWLTDRENESPWLKLIKWRSKVASICKWSFRVSAGNQYLCDFAKKYNPNVVLNPTTIDTEGLHNPSLFKVIRNPEKICIGWTGSHSTLKYLTAIEGVLADLEKKYPQLEFLVIADQAPELSLQNLRFLPWSLETEISGLVQANIGMMPLPEDEWAKGKCGFKVLQYMALEIPALAAPVGVNVNIVNHGQNGFLCSTADEWRTSLELLIGNATLRTQMGKSGRVQVLNNYSVLSNRDNFLSLFRK